MGIIFLPKTRFDFKLIFPLAFQLNGPDRLLPGSINIPVGMAGVVDSSTSRPMALEDLQNAFPLYTCFFFFFFLPTAWCAGSIIVCQLKAGNSRQNVALWQIWFILLTFIHGLLPDEPFACAPFLVCKCILTSIHYYCGYRILKLFR